MPFGPSDDLTRSATASAPMIDAIRACSPFASWPPASKRFTGENASAIAILLQGSVGKGAGVRAARTVRLGGFKAGRVP